MADSVRPPSADAAQLAGLLRRQSALCVRCAAAKLALDVHRVREAIKVLRKRQWLEEAIAACSVCGRSGPVLALQR
jgi:hypothetical protein